MRFDAKVTINSTPGVTHVRICLENLPTGYESWFVKLPSAISFHAVQTLIDFGTGLGQCRLGVSSPTSHVPLYTRQLTRELPNYEATNGPNIVPMIKTETLHIYTMTQPILNQPTTPPSPKITIDLWGRIIRRFSNRKP